MSTIDQIPEMPEPETHHAFTDSPPSYTQTPTHPVDIQPPPYENENDNDNDDVRMPGELVFLQEAALLYHQSLLEENPVPINPPDITATKLKNVRNISATIAMLCLIIGVVLLQSEKPISSGQNTSNPTENNDHFTPPPLSIILFTFAGILFSVAAVSAGGLFWRKRNPVAEPINYEMEPISESNAHVQSSINLWDDEETDLIEDDDLASSQLNSRP